MRKTFMPSHARFASLVLVLSGFLGSTLPAHASSLSDWQYNPEQASLGFQIEPGITPRYFLMPNPLRVVVDLPNTVLQTDQTDRTFAGDVSRIRVSEFKPGVTRMVMELAPNSVLQSGQVSLENLGNGQWQIRPLIEVSGTSVIAQPAAATVQTAATTPQPRRNATAIQATSATPQAIATEPVPETVPNAVDLPVIVHGEALPEATSAAASNVAVQRSPSEVPNLSASSSADLAATPELLPPPRPTASAISPLPTPKVTVPVLGSQPPAAAAFTTLINSFEPFPTQTEFTTSLPSVPSSVSSDAGALGESDLSLGLPTLAAETPGVPYLVEFGQPLPGISSEFPAAYYVPE